MENVIIGNKIYSVELKDNKIVTKVIGTHKQSEKEKISGRLFNVDNRLIKTVYDNEKDKIYYTEIEQPNKIVSYVTVIIYLACLYFIYLIIKAV